MKVLIYGAGALGRGFLAPHLAAEGHEIHLVDVQRDLIERLRAERRYRVGMVDPRRGRFEIVQVHVHDAFMLDEEDPAQYPVVFTAVGVDNAPLLYHRLAEAREVVLCENDWDLARQLRVMTGNVHIHFGVPDVIASGTAPPDLRAQGVEMMSEWGELSIEACEGLGIGGQVDRRTIRQRWLRKFFLHNAPHAVAAYLGAKSGCSFIHEVMSSPLGADVHKVMDEIVRAVVELGLIPEEDARAYAERELQRFGCRLLHDPISRVAREPLRKLGREERLIRTTRLVLIVGGRIDILCRAIAAAIAMTDAPPEQVLYWVCQLAPHDPIYWRVQKELRQ